MSAQDVSERDGGRLVAVLMPGVVQDVGRALRCLGGLANISEVYSRPDERRLGLCLSPNSPFASSTFADATDSGGLLLRVRVRRPRSRSDPAAPSIISMNVVGRVTRSYKFDCLMDFALMPVSAGVCVQEQLLPSGRELSSWLELPAPTLLPPAQFARSDKPLQYGYSEKKVDPTSLVDSHLHLKMRPDRTSSVVHFEFSLTAPLPTGPDPVTVNTLVTQLATDTSLAAKLESVERAIAERPVWSRAALQLHTGADIRQLKVILPARMFYMRSGPWRLQWIRFGYDPRVDPESRRYQTLDYRVRFPEVSHGRSTKHKSIEKVRKRAEVWGEVNEAGVKFKPGVLPTQRQIYYQYCDIEVEEVRRLVEEGVRGTCDERWGWLRPEVDPAARAVMNRLLRDALYQVYQGGEGSGGASPAQTD